MTDKKQEHYYRIMNKKRTIFQDAKRGAGHCSPFTKIELEDFRIKGIKPPIDPENIRYDPYLKCDIEILAENAVCAENSPKGIIEYPGFDTSPDLKVVEFLGEYIDTLPDGYIVKPTKVLKEYSSRKFYRKFYQKKKEND